MKSAQKNVVVHLKTLLTMYEKIIIINKIVFFYI